MNQDNFDVHGALFNAAEDANLFSDDCSEFGDVLSQIADILPSELFEALEMAANLRVRAALRSGFTVGWALRGKA